MPSTDSEHASLPEGVVAVIRQGQQVLVIQRGADVPGAGVWAPLSGKIEPGESQEVAVVREVREEVGLDVRPLRKVWECVSDTKTHLLHWWLVEWVGGALALDPREVSDARWVTVVEYVSLGQTFEKDQQFFREVWPSL